MRKNRHLSPLYQLRSFCFLFNIHFLEITIKNQRTNILRIYTDTYYPCFRREPVQQRNRGRKMYFRLVILNTPNNGDSRPPGILQRIPSTQLKLQPVGVSPTQSTPLPVKCILGQPPGNVISPSQMNVRVEPAAPKTAIEESAEPQKDQAEIDRALEEVRTTCPFCDKRFSNVAKLENHVSCVHRLPYQCDKCKKAYHTEQALEEHKVIHQPDYFFECRACHVKYKSEGTMKRHYIRVHSNDESSYICEHCGRCYKLKIDLTQHIRRSHVHDEQIDRR